MTTREFQQKKPLSILFTYFKPHRGLFILDLVCATVVALIDLAFPLVTRKSMYDLLPNQQYRTFFIAMGVMMAAFIVRALLYYVISYWGHTFGILVEADIRRDLYHHIQELGFDFYDRNRTGQLMSRLTSDLFELTELAHHGPEDLFISAVTILGALAVMFCLRWELALVLLVLLPVLLTMALRRRRQMSAASRAAKVKTGTINAAIESGLSGVRTTKAFANEEAQQAGFACLILLNLVGESSEHTIDNSFNSTRIGYLLHTTFFDDDGRILVVFEHDGKHFLCLLRRNGVFGEKLNQLHRARRRKGGLLHI